MYKVFFNNKVLYFSSGKNAENNINHTFYDTEIQDFSQFVKKLFEDWERAEKIEIICKNMDETWNRFCNIFKIIKAAGGIVQNRTGACLVIKRRGKWDLPKGKCEKKESNEKCAAREIEEECGIAGLEIVNKITVTYHTYLLKDKFILKKTTWFHFISKGQKKPVPQTEEDITEAVWISKKDLKNIYVNTYPSIIDVTDNFLEENSVA